MDHYDTRFASHWMKYAFEMAEKAMNIGEVPVGAVFVKHPKDENQKFIFEYGEIVSSGHNLTNKNRNVYIYILILM